jgi:protocatechuate 3,4-dioxygenase, beta subunit
MKPILILCVFALTAAACRAQPAGPLPAGEWCGAAEAPARLTNTARLAPPGEPGAPLVITGIVRGADGRPLAGVLLYAYHTNAAGRYVPGPRPRGNERRHGHLRGWLRTGADGGYRIETIRPGPYPGRPDPQHVHLTVQPPGGAERWIDDVVFSDDPRVTPEWLARQQNRGGPGLTHPTRDAHGVLHVRRDILLDR